jgi:predicted nucleic acid-binding protein
VIRWTVDASLAVKWLIPEPLSSEATTWLEGDPEIFVPELFFAEIPNVLWKKVARRELSEDEARRAERAVRVLSLNVVSNRGIAEAALDLAFKLRGNAYDCFYLAVAIGFEAPLVTADRKLAVALKGTPFASRVRWVAAVPNE